MIKISAKFGAHCCYFVFRSSLFQHSLIKDTIMGIKDLSKVIGDHAPSSILSNEMKNYFGESTRICVFVK